ncbi:hypothetical protein C8R43DRAFT_1028067 [Mycena crocata]|nr:hypothetical protein C8R43DRAFT_1028067 [Mycena crocata]
MDSTDPYAYSQTGQRYNFTSGGPYHDDDGNLVQRSDDDDSQSASQWDDPTLLVDHLANNYGLDNGHRDELHAFLDVARPLPPLQLKISLFQQVATLQNHQVLDELRALCTAIQEGIVAVKNSLSINPVLNKDQHAEINSACRAQFFTGRRVEFDNETIKAAVVPSLRKNKGTNGMALFFEGNNLMLIRLINTAVGRACSYTKTFLRRILAQSISDGNENPGIGVTALTTSLAKKCLGGSENARAKHAIWCLIIRALIRGDKTLRMAANTDAGDDEDDDDFPAAISVPAKRTSSGTTKAHLPDKKIVTAFWHRVQTLFADKNRVFGTDLQSPGWTDYINQCIVQEKVMYPSDPLTLIVGTAAVITATPSSSANRLAGLTHQRTPSDAGPSSRGVLTPLGVNGSSTAFGTNLPSLDQMMRTPTNFTLGGVPVESRSGSSSGYMLPPIDTSSRGSSHRDNARHPY